MNYRRYLCNEENCNQGSTGGRRDGIDMYVCIVCTYRYLRREECVCLYVCGCVCITFRYGVECSVKLGN